MTYTVVTQSNETLTQMLKRKAQINRKEKLRKLMPVATIETINYTNDGGNI